MIISIIIALVAAYFIISFIPELLKLGVIIILFGLVMGIIYLIGSLEGVLPLVGIVALLYTIVHCVNKSQKKRALKDHEIKTTQKEQQRIDAIIQRKAEALELKIKLNKERKENQKRERLINRAIHKRIPLKD